MTLVEREQGVQLKGATLRPIHPTITARLEFLIEVAEREWGGVDA